MPILDIESKSIEIHVNSKKLILPILKMTKMVKEIPALLYLRNLGIECISTLQNIVYIQVYNSGLPIARIIMTV